jgi:hypothetical protein
MDPQPNYNKQIRVGNIRTHFSQEVGSNFGSGKPDNIPKQCYHSIKIKNPSSDDKKPKKTQVELNSKLLKH